MIHICRQALYIGKHFENQIAAIIKDKHFRKNLWCPGFNEKIDVPSLYSKLIFDFKMMCINFLNIIKIEKSIFVKINIYFRGIFFRNTIWHCWHASFISDRFLLRFVIATCLSSNRIFFFKPAYLDFRTKYTYTCYSRIVSINRKLWQGL